MLTERTTVGKIEILEDGQMQLRIDTVIEKDGVEISRLYHRGVLEPGQDISTQDPRVQTVCDVLWTPRVIEDYKTAKARNTTKDANSR